MTESRFSSVVGLGVGCFTWGLRQSLDRGIDSRMISVGRGTSVRSPLGDIAVVNAEACVASLFLGFDPCDLALPLVFLEFCLFLFLFLPMVAKRRC
jgi:hypothetical protein